MSKQGSVELQISPLKRGRLTLRLVGETPLYFNAMSAKARRDLLIGGTRKTAAQKKEIKHDPFAEFHASVYREESGPTLLGFPAPAVKAAMATAALETEGVTKTSVQRLIFLPHYRLPIYGKPLLKMDVVRSADIGKTPDVRTRAFLPRWATQLEIAYVTPTLSAHAIVSLLVNAGIVCGIGDFRQEKGRGSFGTFRVLGPDEQDDEWDALMAEGRQAQEAAMGAAEPADADTRELLAQFRQEQMRRAA